MRYLLPYLVDFVAGMMNLLTHGHKFDTESLYDPI